MSGPILDLSGLLGETAEAASERFGTAGVDRVLGEDRWMVFEGAGWSLRVRTAPERAGGAAHVRSWTAVFEAGFKTLLEACDALGLPAPPSSLGSHALRLPMIDHIGRVHSLTAVERGGRIRSVTAFDEPPDWADGAGAT